MEISEILKFVNGILFLLLIVTLHIDMTNWFKIVCENQKELYEQLKRKNNSDK